MMIPLLSSAAFIACLSTPAALPPDFVTARPGGAEDACPPLFYPDDDRMALLAHKLMEAGRTDEAIRSLREGLEAVPDSYTLRVNLGQALRETGRLEEANELFRRARESDPEQFRAYFEEGYSRLNSGDLGAARAHMEALVAANPTDPKSVHHLGGIYGRSERWGEALACFEKARALWEAGDPGELRGNHYLRTLRWLARSLYELGRSDEALPLFQRVIDGTTDGAPFHGYTAQMGKARILWERGQVRAAAETLERGIADCEEQKRDCPMMSILLAQVLREGSPEDSMRSARKAMRTLAAHPVEGSGYVAAYSQAMLYFDAVGEEGLADEAAAKTVSGLSSLVGAGVSDIGVAEVCESVGAHLLKRGDVAGSSAQFCRAADIYGLFGERRRETAARKKCLRPTRGQ